MTNRELLKRLQELETAERDVASSMDMPQENTANWAYAETAAIARSAILQQEEGLANYAQENRQLKEAILAARRNGSAPEAFWLQEPQSAPQNGE
jgi:hypothetical protein